MFRSVTLLTPAFEFSQGFVRQEWECDNNAVPRTKRKTASIEINAEFKRALDLMEAGEKSVFITGRAGTGKSTLLDYFRNTTKKNVVVLAPTGVAALNIRGQTIHSFFGFKPDITLEKVRRLRSLSQIKLFRDADAIVAYR